MTSTELTALCTMWIESSKSFSDRLMMERISSTSTARIAMIRRSGRAVNVDRSSASFGFDLRDVFAYDLLTNQLRALHLLLG